MEMEMEMGGTGAVRSLSNLLLLLSLFFFCYSLEKSMIRRRTQRGRRKDMYVVRDVA